MVADAEFTSYYGRPILKGPVWKVPDVPTYLYAGGLAGSSALMAAMAEATGRPGLRRVGRLAAAAAAAAGTGALVHDLGRPERFLNMLRVVKPTSPLSVGSWILAPFGGLSAAAAASELTGRLPGLGRLAGLGSAALGAPLTTYTAVLLANTAVPAWHEAHPELPFVFAGSALASGGGVGLAVAPAAETGPARRMLLVGAAVELGASQRMEHRLGLVGEPYRTGRPGALLRAGRLLTAAAAVGAMAGACAGPLTRPDRPPGRLGPARRAGVAGRLGVARRAGAAVPGGLAGRGGVAGLLGVAGRAGMAGRAGGAGRGGVVGRLGVAGRRGGRGRADALVRSARALDRLSGVLANAGALCTRFGIFTAGQVSAADPKYTVVPQRQRLTDRESAAPASEHPSRE